MKLIHCADLHLDSKMSVNLTPEQAKERRVELLLTFQRMVNYAKDTKVRAVIIAGDLFDQSQPSVSSVNMVFDVIRSAPDIHFYYLKGNHDEDLSLYASEKVPLNLRKFGEKWGRIVFKGSKAKNTADIAIYGKELPEDGRDTSFALAEMDAEQMNLVILHGQLTDYGFDKEGYKIPLSKLKGRNIDYLALGHIHKYSTGVIDERGIWCYPGCLEGRGFDECGEHGFVVVDIDNLRRTVTTEFVPFASRSLYQVPVDVSDCRTTMDICEKIRSTAAEKECTSSDLLEIILQGKVEMAFELDPVLLRKLLEQEYYFVKITDETTLAAEPGDYALDQSLKGEFIRLVMAREDLDDQMKAEVIRCGVASLMGER